MFAKYAFLDFNIVMRTNLGILMPVASLPARHGIGDFGETSIRFIDWLSKNHYRYWQILPLNPLGPGDSPYMSACSYAFDWRYINLDLLVEDGLLDKVPNYRKAASEINYWRVGNFKKKWLWKAYLNYLKTPMNGLKKFKTKNPWVVHFATFEVFKQMNDNRAWNEWEEWQINYFQEHTNAPKHLLKQINFSIFIQYVAAKQWKRVLSHARRRGVKLIADMPFYCGFDSIEVWLNQDQFLIENHRQTHEGGVPPDAFSDVGQLWGSPIYNFEKMKENNYSLLVNRTGFLASICDYLRLDHFRAFDTYYVIPAGMPDAKIGEWKVGPRTDFFEALYKAYPNINLIAEDLGELFPSVLELRDHYNFPGMFIVEFTVFDQNAWPNNNMIVYTGTHDNATLLGWLNSLPRHDIDHLKWKFNEQDESKLFDRLFEYTLSLPSLMTIFPLQDLLKLDNRARLNTPGTVGYPNFVWKIKSFDCLKKIKFKIK